MTSADDDHDSAAGDAPTQTVALPAPPDYPTGAEAMQRNTFAVVGLVLGILPLPLFGAIPSILGIRRARTVKLGMRMSIVGLVLSILWAGVGVVVAVIAPHIAKASRPGCAIIAQYNRDYPASKLAADRAAGGTPYIADLQAYLASLNRAAAVTRHPDLRSAAMTEAADIDIVVQYLRQGAQPDAATVMKQRNDNDVLRAACGSF